MTYILGIDPGNDGALVLLGDESIEFHDMPTFRKAKGAGGLRTTVDLRRLWQIMQGYAFVDLVVIEHVGGRPRQAAGAAFNFGFGVGALHQCCTALDLHVQTVTPAVWKRWAGVPGKSSSAMTASLMKTAEARLPGCVKDLYTPRGRALDGRAEAAFLALYGREQLLKLGRWVG